MEKKLSGIFEQKIIAQNEKLTKLLPSMIFVPVSRYATNKSTDINKVRELSIIVDSKVSGPCLVTDKIKNRYYNFNHFEYDFDTLKNEYERDLKLDKKTPLPSNYFPDDDPQKKPADCWSKNSHIFFSNWLKLISEKVCSLFLKVPVVIIKGNAFKEAFRYLWVYDNWLLLPYLDLTIPGTW